jgi:enediyne biosynthesis protein E4
MTFASDLPPVITLMCARLQRGILLVVCSHAIAAIGLGCGTSSDDTLVASVCVDPPRGPLVQWFSDVTRASGIDFEYTSANYKGGGLAVADLDGDGLPDVVASRRDGGLAVFRNRGSFKFELDPDTGLDPTLAIQAIAAGDLNNDGHPDLVLAGSNVAYVMLNAGDGTFQEASRLTNSGSTEAVLLVDVDGDGRLDIYLSNYDLVTPSLSSNVLYMQRDGFVFENVVVQGATSGMKETWATTAFDIDDDGHIDLYLANDTLLADYGRPVPGNATTSNLTPDQLFHNEGSLTAIGVEHLAEATDRTVQFLDIATPMGLGTPRSSMGGLLADFNQDGRLDLFVPNLGAKKLFIRSPDGGFVDGAAAFGVQGIQRSNDVCLPDTDDPNCLMLSWSAALSDFDLDGNDDLLVVNGINYMGQSPPPPLLYKRDATLVYQEVSSEIGCFDARGMVVTDLDGDGDQDVLLTQTNGPLIVYENRSHPQPSQWLNVRLHGTVSSRDGNGAVVTAYLKSGHEVMRVIGAGGVINSSSPPEAFFGLGGDIVESVVVQWPSGRRSEAQYPGGGIVEISEPE